MSSFKSCIHTNTQEHVIRRYLGVILASILKKSLDGKWHLLPLSCALAYTAATLTCKITRYCFSVKEFNCGSSCKVFMVLKLFYFKGHVKSILQLSLKRIRHCNAFQAATVVKNYNLWSIKSEKIASKSEIQVHDSCLLCSALKLWMHMVLGTEGSYQGAFKVCFFFFFLIVSEFSGNLYHQYLAIKMQ